MTRTCVLCKRICHPCILSCKSPPPICQESFHKSCDEFIYGKTLDKICKNKTHLKTSTRFFFLAKNFLLHSKPTSEMRASQQVHARSSLLSLSATHNKPFQHFHMPITTLTHCNYSCIFQNHDKFNSLSSKQNNDKNKKKKNLPPINHIASLPMIHC